MLCGYHFPSRFFFVLCVFRVRIRVRELGLVLGFRASVNIKVRLTVRVLKAGSCFLLSKR